MVDSVCWSDYKHYTLFDPQQYDINDNILTVEKGLFFKKTSSIPLYSLKEAKLSRSLIQRIFGLCTISFVSRGDPETVIAVENVWYDQGKLYRSIVCEIDRAYREMYMHHFNRNYAFVDYDDDFIR